ncbi:hypothetical protein [Ornithinimicrobium murale]|uniref:hypothetical protein n=1 Tax=Ornithinimicrobium murale TaxID=1050153 RepID=UPI000E0D112A|nr:hypothetical protein [Ornithinimicrobium murale]
MATYNGSNVEASGGEVLTMERCECKTCPVDPFACPSCGGEVDYYWRECPHEAPEQRWSLVVRTVGGSQARLVHARHSSIIEAVLSEVK